MLINMHVWICVYGCVCCVTMHVCKHQLLCAMYVCISVSNSKGQISFTKDDSLFLNSLFKQNFYPLLENMGHVLVYPSTEVLRPIAVVSLWKSLGCLELRGHFFVVPALSPALHNSPHFQALSNGFHGNQRDPNCVECRFPLH